MGSGASIEGLAEPVLDSGISCLTSIKVDWSINRTLNSNSKIMAPHMRGWVWVQGLGYALLHGVQVGFSSFGCA